MPVLPLRDARLGDVDAHLSAVQRMHQFGERPSLIDIHLKVKGRLLVRQIAQIGAVQLLCKRTRRNLRYHQRLGLLRKALQQRDDLSQRRLVRNWHIAIPAIGLWQYLQPIELTMMLPALQGGHHLVHEVIDIQQFQLHRGVVHRVGQIISKSIAERRHRRVVVRAAPLTEEVREAVYQHLCPGLFLIVQEQLLASLLATAILGVSEASSQRCLLRTGEHHGTPVALPLQGVEQRRGKPEVAVHKLGRILRPVHPGQVEYEVALPTPHLQHRRVRINIILPYLLDN